MIVFVPLPSLTNKSKGAVRSVTAPAERGISSVGKRLTETAAAIRGIGGAVEKTRKLENDLVHVQSELNRLRDIEIENVRLKRALKFREPHPNVMIPSDVISRNISGWWSTVRIGKGRRDGVELNRAVISPDGLVGKINDVNPFSSEVLLISDPACRVSAKLARADIYGIVRGAGSNLKGHPLARMEFINKDAPVHLGDKVVASGLQTVGGAFPKGIKIGYVEKVYTDESGLFQSAEIIPSATIGLLDYIFVVTDEEREMAP